jgi:SAM-dependent methyltransferase
MNTSTTTRTQEISRAATLPQADASSLSTPRPSRQRSRRCTAKSRRRTGLSFTSTRARACRTPGLSTRAPRREPERGACLICRCRLPPRYGRARTQRERVLDLGSGSGTDVFAAAVQVGRSGRAVGVDFTPEQLAKAARLHDHDRFARSASSKRASTRCPSTTRPLTP